ncbi:MAG: pentapeptide repeat-containing protein [Geitlerinemataceae cyanobacterium]
MDDFSTVLSDPHAFLAASGIDRARWLRAIGLGRYRFLTQLAASTANEICVARFLERPEVVKFPDLRGADLAGLDLRGVNFIRGKLGGADLSGCDLREADLLFANFSRTKLREADLRGATLDRTVWTEAIVSGCDLSDTRGLTPAQRQNLAKRGAIVR